MKFAIEDKLDFRDQLAQAVSITRLDYILKTLRMVLQKGVIPDPDSFKDKIRQMNREDRIKFQKGLKRSKTSVSSMMSFYSRPSATKSASGASSNNQEDLFDDDEENEDEMERINNDPILNGVNEMFNDISYEINNHAIERVQKLEEIFSNKYMKGVGGKRKQSKKDLLNESLSDDYF